MAQEECEVVKYLRVLDVAEDVIERFKSEKIDLDAASMMRESDFESMGLKAKGDRLKLMAFCRSREKGSSSAKNDERAAKIAKIKELIKNGKRKRGTSTSSTTTKEEGSEKPKKSKTSLRFEVGWKHWNDKKHSYVQKKKSSGGGTRIIYLEKDISRADCIKLFKDLFFPQGKNSAGPAGLMIFALGNYQGEMIEYASFTPSSYKSATGFNNPRLYLLSRRRSISDTWPDSNDEEDSLENVFEIDEPKKTESPPPSRHSSISDTWPDSDDEEDGLESVLEIKETKRAVSPPHKVLDDGLIGTSEERSKYRAELEMAIKESLEADRKKAVMIKPTNPQIVIDDTTDTESETENLKKQEAQKLMERRLKRVPPEPAEEEKKVNVTVKHCNGNTLKRSFKDTDQVSVLYDWIGSLGLDPMYFSLKKWPNIKLFPEDPITKASQHEAGIVYMTEEKEPTNLGSDEHEVFFDEDFDCVELEETVKSDVPEPIEVAGPSPPLQLMEEDDENLNKLDELERKRYFMLTKISKQPPRLITIHRQHIVDELLEVYKDEHILSYPLMAGFHGESADGDGILRDLYAAFWDSFTSQYCEGSSQFSLKVHPSLTEPDYCAVGRIITHQFMLTGTFPVNICEMQIVHIIFGEETAEVEEDCILCSVKAFVTAKEACIITQALEGVSPFPYNGLLDILSDHGIAVLPTPENIKNSLISLAKHEFLQKPYMALLYVKRGMGNFWCEAQVSRTEMEALYSLSVPSSKNISTFLDVECNSSVEHKVSRWMVRYLEMQTTKMLYKFLRFCTGASILAPGKKITVRFEAMSEVSMRPVSKTCFRLLYLPSNIHSFAQLASIFDKCLHDENLWDLQD